MSWICFVYAHSLKTHVLPSQLAEIHQEYLDDGHMLHEVAGSKVTTTCYLDLGGPIYAQRPIEIFFVDGLELCLASAELPLFMETWPTLPKRKTRSRSSDYYKLHGARVALVLAPMAYQRLMADIAARMPEAKLRADAFSAKLRPIDEVIAEYNNRGKA